MISNADKNRFAVFKSLEEKETITVFPTESSLRFWLLDYAEKSEKGVIRWDKAMAWDTFRAHFLPESEKVPTNQIIRELFAHLFLSDKTKIKNLKWFRYDNSAFNLSNLSTTVVKTLNYLKELADMKENEDSFYKNLPLSYRQDIDYLSHHYGLFLNEHNLYEQNLESLNVENATALLGKKYRLFFPEVCKGWQEFSKISDTISYLEIYSDASLNEEINLKLYKNELIELKATLNEISALLKQGVPSHEIVVTVGNLKRWQPYLENESRKEGLSFSFAAGKSLLAYPAGSYFNSLSNVYSQNYSLEAMSIFLLDPRIPWKDKESAHQLIRRAVELKISDKDAWFYKLQRGGEKDAKLLDFFKSFESLITKLNRLNSEKELLQTLFTFNQLFLDESKWEEDQTFSFCLGQLNQFNDALKKIGSKKIEGLWALFVAHLAKQQFISAERKEGILVYPYTVSVAILPKYHFIIGSTYESTKIDKITLPFVGEHEWNHLISEDQSETYLKHYLNCGTTLSISSSETVFGNSVELAIPYFVEKEKVVKTTFVNNNNDYNEVEFYSEQKRSSYKPKFRQVKNFNRAKIAAFSHSFVDMANDESVTAVIERTKELSLSPSQLDNFISCPFKWVLISLLKIEELTFIVEQLDNLEIGNLLHTILEQFFKEIGIFDENRISSYYKILDEIIADNFANFARKIKAPEKIALDYLRSHYQFLLPQIIECELKEFAGFGSEGFEVTLSKKDETLNVTLNGRIDRIASIVRQDKEKVLAIIDFKKSFSGSLAKYRDSENIASHQLPFYAKLLHEIGINNSYANVEIGSYYGVEQTKYSKIWTSEKLNERDNLIDAVDKNIELMVKQLKRGIVTATPSKESCQFCSFRQVCRRRYALI